MKTILRRKMISFIIIMPYLNRRLMAIWVRGCVPTRLKLQSGQPDSVSRERATKRTDDESGHHYLARLSGAKGQGRLQQYRIACPQSHVPGATSAWPTPIIVIIIIILYRHRSAPLRSKRFFSIKQIVYKYPCGTQTINSIVDRQSVLGTSYYGRAITI